MRLLASVGENPLQEVWDRRYLGGLYEAAPPVEAVREFVTDHLGRLAAGDVVLDVGCGNGRHLRALAGSTAIVGCDLSGRGLRTLAITLALENKAARLAQSRHRDLPFAAESFAAGLAVQTLQDGPLAEAAAGLGELWRVLRRGAPLFVRLPAATAARSWAHAPTGEPGTVEYLAGPKAGLAVHWFTPDEMVSLATGAGFDIVAPPVERVEPRLPPLVGRMHYLDLVVTKAGPRQV